MPISNSGSCKGDKKWVEAGTMWLAVDKETSARPRIRFYKPCTQKQSTICSKFTHTTRWLLCSKLQVFKETSTENSHHLFIYLFMYFCIFELRSSTVMAQRGTPLRTRQSPSVGVTLAHIESWQSSVCLMSDDGSERNCRVIWCGGIARLCLQMLLVCSLKHQRGEGRGG